MIFYEAPHRIMECLIDLQKCFGDEREITMARELTKTFETILFGTILQLLERVKSDANQQKGEIVLVLAGCQAKRQEVDESSIHTLKILLNELPLKQACALAAQITGQKKNILYAMALELKQQPV